MRGKQVGAGILRRVRTEQDDGDALGGCQRVEHDLQREPDRVGQQQLLFRVRPGIGSPLAPRPEDPSLRAPWAVTGLSD